jgi:hypothetical protein
MKWSRLSIPGDGGVPGSCNIYYDGRGIHVLMIAGKMPPKCVLPG